MRGRPLGLHTCSRGLTLFAVFLTGCARHHRVTCIEHYLCCLIWQLLAPIPMCKQTDKMHWNFHKLSIFFLQTLMIFQWVRPGGAAYDDDLNCLVCEVVVDEVEKAVAAIDPKQVIDLGGRLQADGSRKTIKKQYRRSELHLGEVLETVCEKMDDYAQGHWKDTGRKDLLQIMVDGAMNPRMPEFEFLQDSNLNRGIKDYCQTIVEEQEDELMKFLSEEHDNPSHQFCYHETSLCPKHSHGSDEL